MLNKELLMCFLPGISWILFSLGGTQITEDNSIKGQKWLRRFVLPFVYFLTCLIMSVTWWQSLFVACIAIGAFHLGYGLHTSWGGRILVGFTYGMISLPIGVSFWNLITVVMFIILFWLSYYGNKTGWSKLFIWKICEGFFGMFVGIQLAYLLIGYGLRWF